MSNFDLSGAIPIGKNDPEIVTEMEKPPLSAGTAAPMVMMAPTDRTDALFPCQKIVGHTFHVFRTVLKPRVYRQIITVPYIQRYVRYFQVPVIETYHYRQDVPY